MSHTQGPWEYNEEELSTGMSFDVYNENGKRITEAYVTQKEARLIAAAPELLEALEDIYKRGYEMSQYEMVRSLIAKARGQ